MSGMNGTNALAGSPMSIIEHELLHACSDVVECQHEMLGLLAKTLGARSNEVFYLWMRRTIHQRWHLDGSDWKCFFHGFECDLENTNDGRLLRLDFGPGGRVDTFTMWGVLRFVMTSVAPWPEYPELRVQFAEHEESTNSFGGSMDAIGIVWDRLSVLGVFEPADAGLIEFQKKHTLIGSDGLQRITYPEGASDELTYDCSVAHRPVLSSMGKRLLLKHNAGFAQSALR